MLKVWDCLGIRFIFYQLSRRIRYSSSLFLIGFGVVVNFLRGGVLLNLIELGQYLMRLRVVPVLD